MKNETRNILVATLERCFTTEGMHLPAGQTIYVVGSLPFAWPEDGNNFLAATTVAVDKYGISVGWLASIPKHYVKAQRVTRLFDLHHLDEALFCAIECAISDLDDGRLPPRPSPSPSKEARQ